jgi:hypothetical protein
MLLTLFEMSVIVTVAIHFVWWQIRVRRRRTVAWKTLLVNLQPKRGDIELADNHHWNRDPFAMPEEKWRSTNVAEGLWTMYENAGVMLDIANYAAFNSTVTNPELITALRRDAFRIRVCVIVALSKYARSQVNESTCAIVSRATAYYADMVKRTAELAQANGTALAPGFAASMSM